MGRENPDAKFTKSLLTLAVAAQDLWSIALHNPAARVAVRDFTTPPVIL
jgi:hypothetical protein